jgi:chemotaxis protein histidine kinase CheA
VQVPIEDLEKQVMRLESWQRSSQTPMMDSEILDLKRVISLWAFPSAEDVFREFCEMIPSLAKDLGKLNPEICIKADDLYFTHGGVELLRNTFVHIIRNSLDHGIETKEERLAIGKRAQGRLDITASIDSKDHLEIQFKDDGRGLALKMIAEIAIIKNFIHQNQRPSSLELARLIFHPGFSTSSGINEISGRGVGMDAVKCWLKNGQAEVDIQLADQSAYPSIPDFMPFTLIIRLPPRFFRKIDKHRSLAQAS